MSLPGKNSSPNAAFRNKRFTNYHFVSVTVLSQPIVEFRSFIHSKFLYSTNALWASAVCATLFTRIRRRPVRASSYWSSLRYLFLSFPLRSHSAYPRCSPISHTRFPTRQSVRLLFEGHYSMVKRQCALSTWFRPIAL